MQLGIDMADFVPIIGAFFGGLALLAGAFFKYMDIREKAAKEERKEERAKFEKIVTVLTESRDANTKAIEKNSEAMMEVANATKKAADEAEKRNGHLAELQLASQKMIADNFNAIHNISEQKVQHQTVLNETVKAKE